MFERRTMALAVAAALCFPYAARAASDEELKDLREQVRQLQEQYDKRVDALEQRLREAEAAANQAAVQASSRPASESAMNPGVSLILNGIYSNLSQPPAGFRIDGFVPTMGEVAPPARGLSLGESELAFAANIDHMFRGTLVASLASEGGADVEESYIQTLALSNGFTLKAGRFFSGVGYQNQVHAHAWDFADAPLANKVFLGNQLADDGIQLKWIAPSDLYIDLGGEAGRGRKFPAGPDGGRDKNGFGSGVLFAHAGGDIGASTAWQLGVSHLQTSPQDRSYTDLNSTGTTVTDSFSGRSRLWAVSGILKWAPNGNPTETSFKLQGEYFRRNEDGDLRYDTLAQAGSPQTGTLNSRQSGWYLQGVYQFMPLWRIGVRYDRVDSGTVALGAPLSAADFPILNAYNPSRETAMLDWNPSEFSRVRLQLARDASRRDATDHQVLVQYIVSLGAHGAHTF
jgi:hypothetical protein